ncbi:heavy-metal-associated domain-containing protein [Streptomyces sp. YGL11-2]|uniref:heavy-metal-associated domain-containing protein n=1 Tax=Streptomyces sp. YGL11-2 TaxID=3414028 RepID=UPI003CF8F340
MTQKQYKQYYVTGMSCEHCAASIREEVSEVPGVSEVVVDLATNVVTVSGTGLDDERVRAAIVEAGYGVADPVAA